MSDHEIITREQLDTLTARLHRVGLDGKSGELEELGTSVLDGLAGALHHLAMVFASHNEAELHDACEAVATTAEKEWQQIARR